MTTASACALRFGWGRTSLLALALAAAPAEPAEKGNLVFPVDCRLGVDCFIQQYVDRDPGPGAVDFTCGPLTYDQHNGTDIRLPDRATMERGVDVLSATPGEVLGIRDGMEDRAQHGANPPDVRGRECGNGVLIRRADGWKFQYCHLARGSVSVAKGDMIEAGQVIGRIGLSGKTQFPHVHFQISDQNGRFIDPFDARERNESCTLRDRRTLWATMDAQDYQPGGPLAAGMATALPDYDDVRAGTAHVPALSPDAPAVVFWAHFFGLRKGDRIALRLVAPDGTLVAESTHQLDRNRAAEYRAVGRRVRGAWAPGTYLGTADLIRDGNRIEGITATVEVR